MCLGSCNCQRYVHTCHALFEPCARLQDDELLKGVVSYYRLMAAWMLRLASPAAAASGGPPELPLPSPAPLEFRMLPVRHPWTLTSKPQMAS